MLTVAYRRQVDYFVQGGVSVSQLSSSVRSGRSGQPDGEMVDLSGQPDERNSSNAQIRTLLEEQRQTVIAEDREKVSRHELQAAQPAEERRLPQGKLWQHSLEFREAHQQSLTEKNYGNFRVLPSIQLREENSSSIRTLFWNSQAEYRN